MELTPDIIAQTLDTSQGRHAYAIVERLFDAGFDAWWVGGCVRDMLLGRLPQDIDVGTDALPQQVTKLFTRANAAPALFGSVRIRAGSDEIELTTFREDDEASDGRHPESVVFGNRQQDANRRDFTINAIYWNPITRETYDPCSGRADLSERLVRFIGDPAIRIKHDALRLLRAVRFRAHIDGQYHPETFRALQENAQSVELLSGSRQLEEMEKMLSSQHPDIAYGDLWELQILKFFLPELYDCKGIPQPADYHHEGDVWTHTMMCVAALRPEDDADIRLAALFHDCGKTRTFSLKERIRFDEHAPVSAAIAADVLRRLQCPGKRIEKIRWLIAHHMMMSTFRELSEERKGHWYFHPWFRDLLRLFEIDIAGTTPHDYGLYTQIQHDYNAFVDRHPRPPRQLLSGQDVMDFLGLKPGVQVGKALKLLHDAQLTGTVTTKREAKALLETFKTKQDAEER